MKKLEWPYGGVGYCIVEVETRYETNTGFKGVNDQEIVIDTRYEPLKHVRTCGRVIQTPYAMGERPLRQIPVGLPGYGPVRADKEGQDHPAIYAIGGVYKYKRMSDIEPEVKVGDMIWFQRLVLHRHENIVEEYEKKGGIKVFVFKVDYDLIVCVEKPEPRMIGGWCLLEPMKEYAQMIPTYYDTVGPDGSKAVRPKEEWLVLTMLPAAEKLKGILRHFGKPLKGDEFFYEKDAEVYCRKQIQWRYMYKGKEFILIKQWDIFAEVVEV